VSVTIFLATVTMVCCVLALNMEPASVANVSALLVGQASLASAKHPVTPAFLLVEERSVLAREAASVASASA